MTSGFPSVRRTHLARLGLDESEFEEKFARSSGPGGQHVNKVSTAVTLRHRPSGLAVTVQETRSQAMNRELAWLRLLEAIERARNDERAARRSAAEKERRRKSPRPWGLKQRILEDKRRRAKVKQLRAKDF